MITEEEERTWLPDRICLALWASGLWLRYTTLQNLIPSFPWIALPRPPPWRNPRKGRDQILPSGNLDKCSCSPWPALEGADDEEGEDSLEDVVKVPGVALPRPLLHDGVVDVVVGVDDVVALGGANSVDMLDFGRLFWAI